MTQQKRYLVNAAICVLVLAHAIYRYVTRPEVPSEIWLGLVAAEGVMGAFGIAWFLLRARNTV
jgi:hypothetical protein